ncbi:helix-turn-helix transcriptional regulator [Amycolatopsis sp. NEAU-NG30]|uniref:Helix-turn-helix transcriptional regulator n=1 Tax=Amycolatopsis melonis TaxID=3156488 RepID=A0ABV0LEN6_9PSEU
MPATHWPSPPPAAEEAGTRSRPCRDPRIDPRPRPDDLPRSLPDDRSLGDRVVELRTAHRLTQQELATAAGMSRRHLGRIETGRTLTKSLECVAHLADVLGAERAELALRALRDFEHHEEAPPR